MNGLSYANSWKMSLRVAKNVCCRPNPCKAWESNHREARWTTRGRSGDFDSNGEQKGYKTYNNVDIRKEQAICRICGKVDHMSYTSPFSKRQVVNYLACRKFVDMSPLDRQKTLDEKGLCCQCLSPGQKEAI